MATSPKDKSTAVPSPTSAPQMSLGLDSGTTSPGSAVGPTPSDLLESPTTPTSGPGRALASRSATRARGREFSTLDIFGQHGSHSSASVALQSSLESRLRARMALGGSTLFRLTWNDAVTPSGRRICALRASVLRTPDSGCTSWPTPTVSRGDYSYANGNHDTPTLKLAGAAKTAVWPTPLASDGTASRDTFHHGPNNLTLTGAARTSAWPTPAARDWKSSASNLHGENARPLNEVARLSHWPTPKSSDADRGGQAERVGDQRSNLIDTVQTASWPTPRAADGAKGGKRRVATGQDLPTTAHEAIRPASWATPAAQEAGSTPEQFLARKRKTKAGTHIGESVTSLSLQAQLADSGPMPTGSSAETPPAVRPSPGQLNPEHSRWLMGFPVAWVSYADVATRSSPRSRQRSSVQRSKPSRTPSREEPADGLASGKPDVHDA